MWVSMDSVSTGLFPLKCHCLFHFLLMVKQQAVKCQPDRYVSFLSLDTLHRCSGYRSTFHF